MIQLFILPSSLSSRKAREHLISIGIPFIVRNMKTDPMTFDELKEMLAHTDEGTDELLGTRSLKLKELMDSGVDFDELNLRELHELICEHPTILRAPIALGSHLMVVGYDKDRYNVFKPRAVRMQEHQKYLEILRHDEDIRLAKRLAEQREQEEEHELEMELSI